MLTKEDIDQIVKSIIVLKKEDLRDNVLAFCFDGGFQYIMSQDEFEDIRDSFTENNCFPCLICYLPGKPEILPLEKLEVLVSDLQKVIEEKKKATV